MNKQKEFPEGHFRQTFVWFSIFIFCSVEDRRNVGTHVY